MRFQQSSRRSLRDEFDDPKESGFFSALMKAPFFSKYRFAFIGGGLVLAVIGFSSLMISVMSPADAASAGQVPLVRADATPYKVVPEDRGGMDVPNLGTTVFDNLREDQGAAKVENLLAETDAQPMPKEKLFAGMKDQMQFASASRDFRGNESPLSAAEKRALQAEKNEEALEESAKPLPGNVQALPAEKLPAAPSDSKLVMPDPRSIDTEKVEEIGDAPAAPVTPTPQIEKIAPVAPIDQASRPKTDEPAPAPKPAPSGSTFIQLASIKNSSEAPSHWAKLKAEFSSLSGFDYRVRSADLGAKGTFHRIQAGPMSAEQAQKVCAAIKVRKPGACLIVKE